MITIRFILCAHLSLVVLFNSFKGSTPEEVTSQSPQLQQLREPDQKWLTEQDQERQLMQGTTRPRLVVRTNAPRSTDIRAFKICNIIDCLELKLNLNIFVLYFEQL